MSNGEHQLSISFAAEWLQTEYRPLSSPLESGISPFIFLYLLNMRNFNSLFYNDLAAIHDVHTLGGVLHAAALQVIDFTVHFLTIH